MARQPSVDEQPEQGEQRRESGGCERGGSQGDSGSDQGGTPGLAGPQAGHDQAGDDRREHRVEPQGGGVTHQIAEHHTERGTGRPAHEHAQARGPVGGPPTSGVALRQPEQHRLVVHDVRSEQAPRSFADESPARHAVRQVAGVDEQGCRDGRGDAPPGGQDPHEEELRGTGEHHERDERRRPRRQSGRDRDRAVGDRREADGQADQEDVPHQSGTQCSPYRTHGHYNGHRHLRSSRRTH